MTNKEYLNNIGRLVSGLLPDNHGFVVLAFPFGESPKNRMTYISNADRKDVINAMKEFIIKAGAEEGWMKHLP